MVCATAGDDEPMEITLKVDGMMCDGCAETVTNALKAKRGVKSVKVDLETKKVSVFVECDTMVEGLTRLPELVGAVTKAGFKAEPEF